MISSTSAAAYLSRLEAGRQRNPSVAVAKRLAKALGVPVTKLLKQGDQ
jgi:transcriptional regulator with XRE-family HTH domain